MYNPETTQVTVNDSTGAMAETWAEKIGPQGQDMGEIDALDNSTSISYTENYLPSSFTNKDGQTTTMTYDSDSAGVPDYGRLRTITEPTSADSAGLTTTLAYTDSGGLFRVTSVQTGTKSATGFHYDSYGNITEVDTPAPGTRGTGQTVATTYTYTALGNVQTMVAPSDGYACVNTVFNYTDDSAGNVLSVEQLDEPLVITAYEGDSAGGKVIAQAHFRWDASGRLVAVLDADLNETDYQYNYADQLTYVYYPATGTSGAGRGVPAVYLRIPRRPTAKRAELR